VGEAATVVCAVGLIILFCWPDRDITSGTPFLALFPLKWLLNHSPCHILLIGFSIAETLTTEQMEAALLRSDLWAD